MNFSKILKLLFSLGLPCAFALSFSACATSKVVGGGVANNAPLDSLSVVSFVNAKEIPVVPDDAVYKGTIETDADHACSTESNIALLENSARQTGGNLPQRPAVSGIGKTVKIGFNPATHARP